MASGHSSTSLYEKQKTFLEVLFLKNIKVAGTDKRKDTRLEEMRQVVGLCLRVSQSWQGSQVPKMSAHSLFLPLYASRREKQREREGIRSTLSARMESSLRHTDNYTPAKQFTCCT